MNRPKKAAEMNTKGPWKREGRFIYALQNNNRREENRFSANVQGTTAQRMSYSQTLFSWKPLLICWRLLLMPIRLY